MAELNAELTNETYKQAHRYITLTVHTAPALALWWRIRCAVAVHLVRLGCWAGGMRFEIGDKL